MRKLPESWISRLAEVKDGERLADPVGIAAVIRSGLVRPSLTPTGLFALRVGFAPTHNEMALLDALDRGVVLAEKSWGFDGWLVLRNAPGTVLGRFEQCDLAVCAKNADGIVVGYRATDAGKRLVREMIERFGEGWA